MALPSTRTSKIQPGPFRPRIAITLGDPAGIGPEVVLKALAANPWAEFAEVSLFGSPVVLQQTMEQLAGKTAVSQLPARQVINLIEISLPEPFVHIPFGQATAATGAASFAYLKAAVEQTTAGNFDAIVTAPIAKSAWRSAGHHYPGQTELLAAGASVDRFGMAFIAQSPHTGWQLRTMLATTHIPLRQVPHTLTPELMTTKLDLLVNSLQQDFGVTQPRIAISGLNPHSGEAGQLGREEVDWLIPWVHQQRQRYPQVRLDGPVPPDTMWVLPGQAWFGSDETALQRACDAYLALYHDQGLIPVKLMGFDRAVNTTMGLPFIRTSPDHGTAFDIAGLGLADPGSMVAAIHLAIELACHRYGAALAMAQR